MSPIYIAGIAMTVFGRHLDRSLEDLAREALQGALKDAGCQVQDIGTYFLVSSKLADGTTVLLTDPGILTTSPSLFSRLTYAEATVEDIASECGVAPTAVYYHFGSKEALARAIADADLSGREGLKSFSCAAGVTIIHTKECHRRNTL